MSCQRGRDFVVLTLECYAGITCWECCLLYFLNLAFFAIHNLLIVFNMFGWISHRTRKWHLLSMGATLFSWLVMGAWYGWGYCLCTDWHFKIRRQLGIHQGETSYTELLFNQIPGVAVSRQTADTVTVAVLLLILVATSVVWFFDCRKSGDRTAKSVDFAPSDSTEPS